MNTFANRIIAAVFVVALAAAISLASVGDDAPGRVTPVATDPSVPPASVALQKQGAESKVSEGNVQDMTY
jgi:hypothetical protein